MAEKYSFFDETPSDPRVYTADEFAKYFGTLFKNGVFLDKDINALKVTAAGSTMETVLNLGTAYLEGYRYENDAPITFTHAPADQALKRFDRIVIRLDKELRTIKAQVKVGVVGGSVPSLERTAKVYELCVATVTITPGKSYIDSSQIADERLNEALCGLASPTHMKLHANDHRKGGPDELTPEMIGALPLSGGNLTGPLTINGKAVGWDDVDDRTWEVTFYIDPVNGDNNNSGETQDKAVQNAYGLIGKLKMVNFGRRIIQVPDNAGDVSLDYILNSKPFLGGEIRVVAKGQRIWGLELKNIQAKLIIEGVNLGTSNSRFNNCSFISFYDCTFDFTDNNYSQGLVNVSDNSNISFWSCKFVKPKVDLIWVNDGSTVVTRYCTFDTLLNSRVFTASSATIFIDNNQYNPIGPMKIKYGGGQIFETT